MSKCFEKEDYKILIPEWKGGEDVKVVIFVYETVVKIMIKFANHYIQYNIKKHSHYRYWNIVPIPGETSMVRWNWLMNVDCLYETENLFMDHCQSMLADLKETSIFWGFTRKTSKHLVPCYPWTI